MQCSAIVTGNTCTRSIAASSSPWNLVASPKLGFCLYVAIISCSAAISFCPLATSPSTAATFLSSSLLRGNKFSPSLPSGSLALEEVV